jgi:hypothetical protein
MAPEEPKVPGLVESIALAVAGPALALSLLLLRGATLAPPALFDAGALVLATWGLSPFAHRKLGAFWATLLRGLGIAGAVLVLANALAAPYDAAGFPVALLVLGASVLQARARSGAGGLVADALGLALLAAGWGFSFWLSDGFPEPARLRFALFLAAPVALVGLVLRALALRRGWHVLAPMPVGILLAAALAGSYLGYRGLVAGTVANLPLYEWTLGAFFAALLLARLRRHARAAEVPEAWESDARRHAQDVAPLYDARMAPLAAAVSRYLDTGDGFDAYRATMRRAGDAAPYRKALEQARPVPPGRGRAARPAALRRAEAHRALLQTLRGPTHGTAPPALRKDP